MNKKTIIGTAVMIVGFVLGVVLILEFLDVAKESVDHNYMITYLHGNGKITREFTVVPARLTQTDNLLRVEKALKDKLGTNTLIIAVTEMEMMY